MPVPVTAGEVFEALAQLPLGCGLRAKAWSERLELAPVEERLDVILPWTNAMEPEDAHSNRLRKLVNLLRLELALPQYSSNVYNAQQLMPVTLDALLADFFLHWVAPELESVAVQTRAPAQESLPARGWARLRSPQNGNVWCCVDPGTCFTEGDPGPWNSWRDPVSSQDWWHNELTQEWFFEPAGSEVD